VPQVDQQSESVNVQMSLTDSDSTVVGPLRPMRMHTAQWLPDYEQHLHSWAQDSATAANNGELKRASPREPIRSDTMQMDRRTAYFKKPTITALSDSITR
jgi:hypothetical protein